jgi:hypothetical protein
MHAYASQTQEFSRQVEEFMEGVTAELRHAALYMEKVVVPEVRRDSGRALRAIADQLDRFADKVDPDGKRGL